VVELNIDDGLNRRSQLSHACRGYGLEKVPPLLATLFEVVEDVVELNIDDGLNRP